MSSIKGSTSDLQIPIIDVSRIDSGTGSQLINAMAQYGFVFVKGRNTGFTSETIDHAFSLVGHEDAPLSKAKLFTMAEIQNHLTSAQVTPIF